MILRIVFPLLLLLLLPIFIIDRITLKGNFKKSTRVVFYIPNIILTLGLLFFLSSELRGDGMMQLFAKWLTYILCLGFSELSTAILLLVSACFKKKTALRNVFSVFAFFTGLCTLFVMVYGFTLGYKKLLKEEFVFVNSEVPEKFNGYRIIQISDFHIGTLIKEQELIERFIDKINAENPNLIVFTGDLVNNKSEELEKTKHLLSKLKAEDGVISVMGNHDYMTYFPWNNDEERRNDVKRLQEMEKQMGWTLLLNKNKMIRRGLDSIAIIGVENDGRPPFPALADLEQAQEGIEEGTFCILLSHDPTHWRREILPTTDIPLTLSGHTHAMQFKIGKWSPSAWFYPEWSGAYHEKGRTLFVSEGIGEVMLPFRLGAFPQYAVITLKKK